MEGDTAGDFHEVVDLRDGRVAVVVGDAPGFGGAAAAQAEDLRAGLRVQARKAPSPEGRPSTPSWLWL